MIAFGDVILFQNHREGHRPSPTMAYGIRSFKLRFAQQYWSRGPMAASLFDAVRDELSAATRRQTTIVDS